MTAANAFSRHAAHGWNQIPDNLKPLKLPQETFMFLLILWTKAVWAPASAVVKILIWLTCAFIWKRVNEDIIFYSCFSYFTQNRVPQERFLTDRNRLACLFFRFPRLEVTGVILLSKTCKYHKLVFATELIIQNACLLPGQLTNIHHPYTPASFTPWQTIVLLMVLFSYVAHIDASVLNCACFIIS